MDCFPRRVRAGVARPLTVVGAVLLAVAAAMTPTAPAIGRTRTTTPAPAPVRAKATSDAATVVPRSTTQLVVALTPAWSSSQATLQRYERRKGTWTAVGSAWAARVAPNGSAWGRGLAPVPADAKQHKTEGDDRSPAGVFRLGPAFGYDPAWKQRTKLRYVAVGPRDLFVEDPTSPRYNTHLRLDHDPRTPWEVDQQMQQHDPAHQLKIFVQHNTDPVIPGDGSAIFLHVWRTDATGATATTAGCTAMALEDMETLMEWLDPAARPLFVLLPVPVYARHEAGWGLPRI